MRDDDLTGQIATKIPLDTDFRRYGMNVFSFFMVTLKAAWAIASKEDMILAKTVCPQ